MKTTKMVRVNNRTVFITSLRAGEEFMVHALAPKGEGKKSQLRFFGSRKKAEEFAEDFMKD